MNNKNKKMILIAGPCAMETREQMLVSIDEAKKRQVNFMRVNLWKPRTKPGFDGLGESGLELLEEVAKAGINPGLEVIIPSHAEIVMKRVFHANPHAKLLLWIGSRNQNHLIQQEIARVASEDKRVVLMVKNQPWRNEDHWEGIVEHVMAGGMLKENLLICDRGFAPNSENPQGYRNLPDFEMAMRIREKYGVAMIFDPSHTGGSVPNVFDMAKQSSEYAYDGIIVEVHPDPKNALTDKKQQITWEEFDKMVTGL